MFSCLVFVVLRRLTHRSSGWPWTQSSSCSSWLLTSVSSVQLYKHIYPLHARETRPNPFSNTQHWKSLQKCLSRGNIQSKGRREVSKGPGCVAGSWLWQWHPLPLSPEHSRAQTLLATLREAAMHSQNQTGTNLPSPVSPYVCHTPFWQDAKCYRKHQCPMWYRKFGQIVYTLKSFELDFI